MQKVGKDNKQNFVLSFIAVLWLIFVAIKFIKYHPVSLINFFVIIQGISNFNFSVFLNNILRFFISLVLLAGIFLNALWFGSTLIKKLGLNFESSYEYIAVSVTLGLGILGYVTFLFGVLKLLYIGLFFALWILFGFLGFREFKSLYKKETIVSYKETGFFLKICLILLLSTAIFNLFICLTPELFYDTLNYHLGVANFYKINKKLVPLPFKLHSNFPIHTTMIYLYAMMLNDTILPKMVNWLLGVLVAFGIFEFSKNRLKTENTGILAALTFYLTPIVLFRSWTATTDIGLTAFVTFGLLLLFYNQKQKNQIILSAIFCGFALATKYTAVFFVIPIGIIILLKEKFKNFIPWVIIILIVFSPWLIKNYVWTGNSFYPYLSSFSNEKYPYNTIRQNKDRFRIPTTREIKKIFTSFWHLSIKGGSMLTKTLNDPDYYMLGVVYLAFIVLIFFAKFWKNEIIKFLFIFIAVSYVLWEPVSFLEIKFYIASFPAFAIVVAWAIDQQREKFIYKIYIPSILFLNFYNFLYISPLCQVIYRPLGIITGSIERDEFLLKSHSAYSGYKFINERLPHTAKVLIFGEARCYYIKRNFISWAVQNLNPLFEILKNSDSPEEVYENMRKQKITHIFVNAPEAYRTVDFYISAREWKILENFWKKHLKLIFAKNNNFVYELVEQTERPSQNIIKFIYQLKKIDTAKTS